MNITISTVQEAMINAYSTELDLLIKHIKKLDISEKYALFLELIQLFSTKDNRYAMNINFFARSGLNKNFRIVINGSGITKIIESQEKDWRYLITETFNFVIEEFKTKIKNGLNVNEFIRLLEDLIKLKNIFKEE